MCRVTLSPSGATNILSLLLGLHHQGGACEPFLVLATQTDSGRCTSPTNVDKVEIFPITNYAWEPRVGPIFKT